MSGIDKGQLHFKVRFIPAHVNLYHQVVQRESTPKIHKSNCVYKKYIPLIHQCLLYAYVFVSIASNVYIINIHCKLCRRVFSWKLSSALQNIYLGAALDHTQTQQIVRKNLCGLISTSMLCSSYVCYSFNRYMSFQVYVWEISIVSIN